MTDPWYKKQAAAPSKSAQKKAHARQQILTKPQGSLGELENIALQYAAWQDNEIPKCENIIVRVFAGDHGVCKNHQVSAFPQSVTAQMIHNFINGGAAINVLSNRIGADFAVVNVGVVEPLTFKDNHLIDYQLMNGTHDFTKQAAMSVGVLQQALNAGRDQIHNKKADLFVAGEMGIGNTTSAAAIYSAILKTSPEATVGKGSGVDEDGIERKCDVIKQAFEHHAEALNTPLTILQHLGGLEIAALVGAYIAAAQHKLPIMVDGFISTAAALLAVEINPSVRPWMMFSHQSSEQAHVLALKKLNATPLLNLGMRLGEASGAAMAVPIIQNALCLHAQMATFEQAHVRTH